MCAHTPCTHLPHTHIKLRMFNKVGDSVQHVKIHFGGVSVCKNSVTSENIESTKFH